jgi:hypothetical protein
MSGGTRGKEQQPYSTELWRAYIAKPRVFISSTFYDIRYVREDIERFILEPGYEPIRYEAGAVPYSSKAPIEESA